MKKAIILAFISIFILSCSKDSEESCGQVTELNYSVGSSRIQIYFDSYNVSANSFEIEYGLAGFSQGSGSKVTTSNNYYEFENLENATSYDFYVTSICSTTERSKAAKLLSVTTNPSTCTGTVSAEISQGGLDVIDIDLDYSEGSIDSWIIEYGTQGFTLGTGTVKVVNGYDSYANIENIIPETTYDFYIRALCSDYETDYSQYTFKQYTSLPYCPEPYNLRANYYAGSCSNLIQYACFWDYYYNANVLNYTMSITSPGGNPDNGTWLNTTETSSLIQGYICGDYLYVRANCLDGSSTDWVGPYALN